MRNGSRIHELCGLIQSLILSLSIAIPIGAQTADAQPLGAGAAEYRTVLDRYCVTCHNQRLRTAGLLLDKADTTNVVESRRFGKKFDGSFTMAPCRRLECLVPIRQFQKG